MNALQQTFPILKRIGNIFKKLIEFDNFVLADHNARKNKKHYKEIKNHDKNDDIKEYLHVNLKLELKRNYQIFPVESRSIDFVGYKFYHDHTLLRKSIKKKMIRISKRLNKTNRKKEYVRRRLSSYFGWLKHCNSINFSKKYFGKLTKRYKLPMPEKFVPKKNIISNITNRIIKFIDFKKYDKYFKIYFVKSDLQYVNTCSTSLYNNFIKYNFPQGTKIKIKKIKNKYIIL